MKRKSWRENLKRWLGMGVASVVVASVLTVTTPTAAFASEAEPSPPPGDR